MPSSYLTLLAMVPLLGRQPDQISNMHVNQESGESDDEVIYLGTTTKCHAPKSSSIRKAAGALTMGQNCDARAKSANQGVPHRSKHTPRPDAIPTTPPLRTRHRSKPSRQQTIIPSYMVDILVKLGWSRSGESGERRAVYGSFGRGGRFCYWLDAGKSVPVAQKNVNYARHFQGMTRQQVRAAVYKILDVEFMGTGEV
jgi:hypothetical protein